MKLIKFCKFKRAECRPKAWIAVRLSIDQYGNIFSLFVHIPWIFHGPWFEHIGGHNRYGWQIPVVGFTFWSRGKLSFGRDSYGSTNVYRVNLPTLIFKTHKFVEPF